MYITTGCSFLWCSGCVVITNRLKSPLWPTRRQQWTTSLIILTGQHMKVIVGVYFSVLSVNFFSGVWSILKFFIWNFFLPTAQDQSHIYPSHSYNTNDSPAPPVTAPQQEDYAGPRKNGTQEHSVVNFPTSASDTITIHSGKAKKKLKFVSFSSCTRTFLDEINMFLLLFSIIAKKALRHSGRQSQLCHTDWLWWWQIQTAASFKLVCSDFEVSI